MKNTQTEKVSTETVEAWTDTLLEKNPILGKKLDKLPIDERITPRELFIEVIKFLYLVSAFQIRLTPSLIVDLGWHEFILFTKAYEKFCHLKLGKFIHHTPDDDKSSNNRNYIKTIQCYIIFFGEPPVPIWGEVSKKEWIDSQCGSCQPT
ncbi:glycine-rich domain-containing protein [Xanthovirga aplysinae]|uniref:glycine-rich domain-containing protein n=1 Tax=Xanthovirga aplysinae TaxID=2529853 RepID=UPI0012BB8DEB|nr:hypothetical protein [Xanthovirga aplysinae]MTI32662.1 hypothetical protein [Xanthovirga aplysinae]